jgi:hypothetical protein
MTKKRKSSQSAKILFLCRFYSNVEAARDVEQNDAKKYNKSIGDLRKGTHSGKHISESIKILPLFLHWAWH